jgi:hypothetical protein
VCMCNNSNSNPDALLCPRESASGSGHSLVVSTTQEAVDGSLLRRRLFFSLRSEHSGDESGVVGRLGFTFPVAPRSDRVSERVF